jgi:hypothetical protein
MPLLLTLNEAIADSFFYVRRIAWGKAIAWTKKQPMLADRTGRL